MFFSKLNSVEIPLYWALIFYRIHMQFVCGFFGFFPCLFFNFLSPYLIIRVFFQIIFFFRSKMHLISTLSSKSQIPILVYSWEQEVLNSFPSAWQNFIIIIVTTIITLTANKYRAFTIRQASFQELYIFHSLNPPRSPMR